MPVTWPAGILEKPGVFRKSSVRGMNSRAPVRLPYPAVLGFVEEGEGGDEYRAIAGRTGDGGSDSKGDGGWKECVGRDGGMNN